MGLTRKFQAVREDKYNISRKSEQKLYSHSLIFKKITRNDLILPKAVSVIHLQLTLNMISSVSPCE